jgi:hypothetical protein
MRRLALLLTFSCFVLGDIRVRAADETPEPSEAPSETTEDETANSDEEDKPKTTFKFSGALWANYAYQEWKSPDQGRKRDFRFDNLRLAVDGTHGDYLLFSGQYRLYSYTQALHHAWFGLRPNENNQIELGVTQVPFGLLPWATHSFWFGLGYYVGMEDDYDAGVKWHHSADAWDLHLGFFKNEEYGDATSLDRYSVDVVREGQQQNEEVNQGNVRLAYTFGKGTDHSSEFGVSGEYGGLDNRTTEHTGYHWQAALHYLGRYGDWNPEFQVARYEYHPENPVGVDDRLVLMGNLTSTRLVAAEGTLVNANLRRFWDVDWGPFKRFNIYYNYSHVFKDEDEFKDSQLHDPGCVFEAGPFWIWVDFLVGKNAWYLNDSSDNSGMGAGGTDEWEFRFNVNFEWYF